MCVWQHCSRNLHAQAMPTGEETDFILVSCAGALVADDEPVSAAAVLSHKRKGEQALRYSGLGYTIIRPGPLLEEPGGYKALVFDQARFRSHRRSLAPVCKDWRQLRQGRRGLRTTMM